MCVDAPQRHLPSITIGPYAQKLQINGSMDTCVDNIGCTSASAGSCARIELKRIARSSRCAF